MNAWLAPGKKRTPGERRQAHPGVWKSTKESPRDDFARCWKAAAGAMKTPDPGARARAGPAR
ncbi:hypothetical protein GCM10027418_26030 [Mariniluteicoccus endophyticus]